MILGDKTKIHSPVNHQEYVWVAEYFDGTHITEYDFSTNKPNGFNSINKNKVIRFGLIGNSSQVYFDVGNGVFTVNNHRITVSYKTAEKEYPLTGRALIYNDLITYKDAVSDTNVMSRKRRGSFLTKIVQYNVGYKKVMELHDALINFQCVFSIPTEESAFLAIKITSNQDLDGSLVVRRNGKIVDEIYAPLKAKHTGILNWTIK